MIFRVAGERRSVPRRDASPLRRSVTVAGITLILLIVAADSYEAWQDYRRVVTDNEHIMLSLNRALTEQTERLVQEAEVVLADYGAWTASTEGRSADRQALVARLNSQIVSLPFVSSALLIGADGRVLASTSSDDADRNLKELAVFAAPARAAGDVLYIDRPRTRNGGRDSAPTFALSRRVNTGGGEFAGVIVAHVALQYLIAFYAGVNVTPDTSIRLSRMDGVTLVEYPPRGALRQKSNSAESADGSAAAKERIKYSVTNGDEVIEVSQQVGSYPLTVTLLRSSASVLQPWIQEERSSAARTLTLAVFAALLLMALRSALNRQSHIDQERQRLEQELAGIRQVEALGFLAGGCGARFQQRADGDHRLCRTHPRHGAVRSGNAGQRGSPARGDRASAPAGAPRTDFRPAAQRQLPTHPHRADHRRSGAAAAGDVAGLGARQIERTCGGDQHPGRCHGNLSGAHESVLQRGPRHAGRRHSDHRTADAGGSRARDSGPRSAAAGPMGERVGHRFGHRSGRRADHVDLRALFTRRVRRAHGTGIGLTVVRNIILRMNGALSVDSRLGSGTRMTVYWPAADAATVAAAAATAQLAAPDNAGIGETIMVLDDEKELVVLTEGVAGIALLRAGGLFGRAHGNRGIPQRSQTFRCHFDRRTHAAAARPRVCPSDTRHRSDGAHPSHDGQS